MIEIQEAYRRLAEVAVKSVIESDVESIATTAALGRILGSAVKAQSDHPAFDQSAMDGIAFRYSTSPGEMRVVGTVAAGDTPNNIHVPPGACVRIMTGAPVPADLDTVQMIEQVSIEDDCAVLKAVPTRGRHIRFAGENVRGGQVLYTVGTRITAGVLAGLISQGIRQVNVVRQLRIGVAATGDEVINVQQDLAPGQIYNTNSPAVAALLRTAATDVQDLGVVLDDEAALISFLEKHLHCDILILSGGVSMGDYDLVPGAAAQVGFEQVFHKIKMKPGKPLWFGRHAGGTMLFGLPGNPVSTLVGTMLYIKPVLETLVGGVFRQPLWGRARVETTVGNKGGLTVFRAGTLATRDDQLRVFPLQTSGSGDVYGFSTYETLLRLPPQTVIQAGEAVDVLLPFSPILS